jgi:hypothetical protein
LPMIVTTFATSAMPVSSLIGRQKPRSYTNPPAHV